MELTFTQYKNRRLINITVILLTVIILTLIHLVDPSDYSFYVCGFKDITGIECPTCGTARSLHSFANAEFGESLRYNPLGFIIGIILSVIAGGSVYELLSGRNIKKSFSPGIIKNLLLLIFLLVIVSWMIKIILIL
ncbi:MAG: DUF2752 domain-containing protein [Melioribacteraceae bacterium]|nr:DUF2752 domain-containing protein [Melioribacteraceae bacterium]